MRRGLRFLREGYRKKRLYYQTFAYLMALCVLTASYFGVSISGIMRHEQKENLDELSLLTLRRTVSEVDTVLESHAKNVSKGLWTQDFIHVMVAGVPKTSDRSVRVIDALRSYTEPDGLVAAAGLYIPFSNSVFRSEGGYYEAAKHDDAPLLAALRELPSTGNPADEGVWWRMWDYDGHLFLLVGLSIPSTIGIVYLELRREELARLIQEEELRVEVFDLQGESLLPEQGSMVVPEGAEGLVTRGSARYCFVRSQRTGWCYQYVVSDVGLPGFGEILGLLLPILVVYLLINTLFSYTITRGVYRPINRLMQITVGGGRGVGDTQPHGGSEVDYLELVYSDSLDKNEQYAKLMRSVSDDLMEQLLRRVLTDQEIEDGYIEETLAGLGRGALVRARVVALCGQLTFADANASSVEISLCRRSVLEIASALGGPDTPCHALFLDRNTAAVVLFFPEEWSITECKRQTAELQAELERQVRNLPFRLTMGRGRVGNGIISLWNCFQEALGEAYYQQSAGADSAGAALTPDGLATYYTGRTRHLLATLESGETERARRMLLALAGEVAEQQGADLTAAVRCCEIILDELAERLIAGHVSAGDLESTGISGALRALPACEEVSAALDKVLEAGGRALELLAAYSGKKSHRYVEEAKEYIQSRYMDSNLSLSGTSDAIGISPSYLSVLFSEVTGQRFSDYLARHRIEQAGQYLNATSLTVTQIAFKCGFNSIQSFGRVFKKYTGMAPGQYREISGEKGVVV